MEKLSRTHPQNRLFHALCTEVARQATFLGKKRSAQQWKVLFVSGWMIARSERSELTIGLEGEFVQLRDSTAKMDVASMNDLIEYATAWSLLNGLTLK